MAQTKVISGLSSYWGYITTFLEAGPGTAAELIDKHYVGGWSPSAAMAKRWKLTGTKPEYVLTYKTRDDVDPPMNAISVIEFGDETLAMFEGAWIAIIQKDGSFAVDRID